MVTAKLFTLFSGKMKNIEQELKMRLDEREYNVLLEASRESPQLQSNFYFVSKDVANDVMVRIRQKGSAFILCCKRRLSNANGVSVCDERETEITLADARRMLDNGITATELNRALGADLDGNFRYIGKLNTYRVKFLLDEWVIELDKNEYLEIVDYELECECNRVESLVKLKDYLFYRYGIAFKPSQAKSERYFNALAHKKK